MTNKSAFYYFYFLVAGYAISSFGSFLNMVALSLFVYHLSGSALQTGLYMTLRLVASFFGGLAAGNLVARYPRKPLMIVSDVTQGLGLLVLLVVPSTIQLETLYVLSVVLGLCSTLSGVALRSSIPEIVGQDQRVRANGLLVTGRSFATVLGFASAGMIVAWSGYETAFLIDAITFFISA
ncbi:MAG TPA: MFS transporter, partial [Herpetosiphonaceae bacterium]